MPSFVTTLPDDADRWALAYYIVSLSAYKDPLTGQPLPMPQAEKEDLDDPTVIADTSDTAFRLRSGDAPRNAWAENHGIQLLPVLGPSRQRDRLGAPFQPMRRARKPIMERLVFIQFLVALCMSLAGDLLLPLGDVLRPVRGHRVDQVRHAAAGARQRRRRDR